MNERPKILIVDDIEANLVAMTALLDELDCTVLRAPATTRSACS